MKTLIFVYRHHFGNPLKAFLKIMAKHDADCVSNQTLKKKSKKEPKTFTIFC